MTRNLLSLVSDNSKGGGGGARPPRTPSELEAWCAEENARRLWRKLDRWFFVLETDNGPEIAWHDGFPAIEARAEAEGRPLPRLALEPGEREWTDQAVAAYLARHPRGEPEHFRATMAHWRKGAPWRGGQGGE